MLPQTEGHYNLHEEHYCVARQLASWPEAQHRVKSRVIPFFYPNHLRHGRSVNIFSNNNITLTSQKVILDRIAPYFPALLQFAGIMGRFGLTMSLALFSDYLSILTGHLYVLHLVTTLMFGQLKSMSGSLWNLFRGKRFNVLRQRNDFWEYDVDQLLLGTILMTLIVFLSPTVLMYYMLFALVCFFFGKLSHFAVYLIFV